MEQKISVLPFIKDKSKVLIVSKDEAVIAWLATQGITGTVERGEVTEKEVYHKDIIGTLTPALMAASNTYTEVVLDQDGEYKFRSYLTFEVSTGKVEDSIFTMATIAIAMLPAELLMSVMLMHSLAGGKKAHADEADEVS